jgi:hypothetical protein
MPQLYLNPDSVIKTVSNEEIYEEIQKANKIKKGQLEKFQVRKNFRLKNLKIGPKNSHLIHLIKI